VADAINFFATQRDLASLLATVESKQPLRYVKAGTFKSSAPAARLSWPEIPSLGVVSRGNLNQEVRYLVVGSETDVAVRAVPQPRRAMLYAVDQKANPQSIGFWPGGVFEGLAVLAGEVSTCSDDAFSCELLALFAREIRRQFKRIKSAFVGLEAEQFLDAGYRLTTNVISPREYDLSRD
jgi:hypothetical protein